MANYVSPDPTRYDGWDDYAEALDEAHALDVLSDPPDAVVGRTSRYINGVRYEVVGQTADGRRRLRATSWKDDADMIAACFAAAFGEPVLTPADEVF